MTKLTGSDLFSDDLELRLRASGTVGMQLYGEQANTFVNDERWARGFTALRPILPADRVALVERGSGNSYGAWNPTVLFLGLSAGTVPPPRPQLHQHSVGAPDFFEREPGGRGNPWFATVIKDITIGAFRVLAGRRRFEWLEAWAAHDPTAFLCGAGGAATVLNFSKDSVPMGRPANVDHCVARETLVCWLRAFRPNVVVNVKPLVAQTLVRIFPDCGLDVRVDASARDTARFALGRFADIEVPVITMPIHPTAPGTGFRRVEESKPRVSHAIADALADLCC